MYLKALEISGFKSFAKKAALNFTSPISSIVGPNGSGKSNVAEAFRFVLGEQSIKSMRGKRGEDLIFNGGGDGARVNRASVKVIFDNSKRMLNVDFDEVTLERVVHRDNSNEYFVNGSPVRLKDIVELLAGAHIGASGHHIISQGEADRILNANIRERREMIEDALGLKMYQYKKLESQRKLEKTEENMKSVESLRREIAPHLKFLKKQVEKVEKVQELREELRRLYKEYFKREEIYLDRETALISQEKSPLVAELQKLDKEITEARRVLENSKNRDAKSDELIAIESALHNIRTEKDAIMRELGKIEGEISAGQRAIAKEKEKQAKDEFKTVYLKDVEEVAKKIDVLETIAEIKQLLFGFISSHKNKSDSALIGEIEKDLVGHQKRKSEFEKSLGVFDGQEKAKTLEYNQLREKIEREKDSNRDAEKDVFRIIARQNEVRGVLNGIKTREDKLLFEEQAFKRETDEAYVLVGREIMEYKDFVVVNSADGLEQRSAQYDRQKTIEKIKIRIEDSGAGNSLDIMKEYKEVEERDAFLARELSDLETSKLGLHNLIADLDARIDVEFKEGILKINAQFQNYFSLMFGGGTAGLNVIREKRRKKKSDTDLSAVLSGDGEEVVEEEDGDEGIEINVNLPRKKVKGLMMLSGGERALTSIALLFAISQVNPPPFIILDETDAALDEANSRKYGDMIANLSEYSQLILITHNRETMSRAGVLYGVTMGSDGASKLLSIQFEEAVKVAK
ncbi:MAG: chromosome segregation protein [Patescibacteria group bacterium]|nr:chromosome segregation protein [Patescibacteria group bacterium]